MFVVILDVCGYPGCVWLLWRFVVILEVCGYHGGVWLSWRCLILIPAGKTDNLDRGFSWFFSVLLRENSGTAAPVRHDRFLSLVHQLFIH